LHINAIGAFRRRYPATCRGAAALMCPPGGPKAKVPGCGPVWHARNMGFRSGSGRTAAYVLGCLPHILSFVVNG